MSDVYIDLDLDDEETVSDDPVTEEKPKSKKAPVPDGFMKPTALANELGMRPQQVYGYIRNGAGFPHSTNSDGSFIVPVGSGDPETDARAWILDRRAKTQARREAAAAKAAEAAAAAESAED